MVFSGNQQISRNRVLIIVCATVNCILAVLCIHIYLNAGRDSSPLIEPISRVIFRATSSPREAAKQLLLTPEESKCSTLHFRENCYGDPNVWAVHEGEVIHAVLYDLMLYDDSNVRIHCNDLGHSQDPAVVIVQQGQLYPNGYFDDVPAATVVKHGYPITMRPGSTDNAVMSQFFCQEHFLYTTYLGTYLPKGRPAVVVDAGANIGLASILFTQVINFNGEVLAIEANPSTVEVLEDNVKMLENRVKVIPAALVPESVARDGQSVNFAAESTEQYWAFRVVPDEDIIDGMEVHKVPTLSLADAQSMSSQNVIDFLKLDIEGQEKHILEDKDSWPVLCGVRCMAAELHETLEPGAIGAFEGFLLEACQEDNFQHIATTGEYSLWCRTSVLSENW